MKKSDLVILDKIIALERRNQQLEQMFIDINDLLDEAELEASDRNWVRRVQDVEINTNRIRQVLKTYPHPEVVEKFRKREED